MKYEELFENEELIYFFEDEFLLSTLTVFSNCHKYKLL